MRAATHWSVADIDGLTVWTIDGNEGTGQRLCATLDRRSDQPARRILRNGTVVAINPDDDPSPPDGLTVYGAHKWDRPFLRDFPHLAENAAVNHGETVCRGGRSFRRSEVAAS